MAIHFRNVSDAIDNLEFNGFARPFGFESWISSDGGVEAMIHPRQDDEKTVIVTYWEI